MKIRFTPFLLPFAFAAFGAAIAYTGQSHFWLLPLAVLLPFQKGQFIPLVGLSVLFFYRTERPPEPLDIKIRNFAQVELEDYRGKGKWIASSSLVKFYLSGIDTGYPGMVLQGNLALKPIAKPRFPGDFDFAHYSAKQGIVAYATPIESGIEVVDTLLSPFNQLQYLALNKVRSWPLPKDYKAFILALCLGWKGALDPQVKGVFATTGLMHVLAVSGLHVGLLQLGLNILLFFLPLRLRRWIILGFLWGFALLTGASASVCRATALFSWLAVGQSLRRKSNATNGLFGVGFSLLAWNPSWVADVGFWLSFIAVWALLRYVPAWNKLVRNKGGVLRWLWSGIGVSVLAQIATLPITALMFGRFPLYFLVPNLLLLPMVPLLMGLGVLGLVFPESPPNGWMWMLQFLLYVFFKVAQAVANWPWADVEVYWTGYQALAVALLCLIVLESLISHLTLRKLQFFLLALGTFVALKGMELKRKYQVNEGWVIGNAASCRMLKQHGIYAQKTPRVSDKLFESFRRSNGLIDAGYCECPELAKKVRRSREAPQ